MIRAAIVGIGWWGRTLVGAVQNTSRAIRFTVGHTRTRASAAAFCAENGIALVDDLESVLADDAVDAVVFTTPHSEHAAQLERAASAGKHVFMEKPFTLDVASAERALGAAARAGIVLGIGYHRRFHPAVRELRARIDDGRLGTLVHCYGEQNAPSGLVMSSQSWRADPKETPAGAMTALGVHNLDAMIGLFGRIEEVYCRDISRAMAHGSDTTSLELGLANGMSASLFSSLVAAVAYRLAVFGTKGTVELLTPALDFRFTPTVARAPGAGRHSQPEPEIIAYKGANALAAELEGFAAAIAGGPPFPVTPDEILHGVAVFEAIVRSAATRLPVAVARG